MSMTIPNGQRALWTFLFYVLVAPFLGALAIAVVLLVGPRFAPGEALAGGGVGVVAASAYLWSAIPAALAAAGLVPFVLKRGTFGWIEAAAAGVIALGVAAILFPFPHQGMLAYLAFLSGLVSLAVREVLLRAGILPPSS